MASLYFHFAFGFRRTLRLAHMLDSLVRVSRRVRWNTYWSTTGKSRRVANLCFWLKATNKVDHSEKTQSSFALLPVSTQCEPICERQASPSQLLQHTIRAPGYNMSTFDGQHYLPWNNKLVAQLTVVRTWGKCTKPSSQTFASTASRWMRSRVHDKQPRRRLNPSDPNFGSTRLPLNGFTYSWTLSSKFFSTFPHGTCSLSDSC